MALGINTVLHWLRCPQHEDFSLDGVDNWDQVDAKSRTHSAFNEVNADLTPTRSPNSRTSWGRNPVRCDTHSAALIRG